MSDPTIAWTHTPTARGRHPSRKRSRAEAMGLLARAPLFRDLPKAQLRKVADVSGVRHARAGEQLVKEGVAGNVFFVIVDGQVKVIKGRRTLQRLGPGDFVGEMSILTGALRSASVVAETPVECLTLSSTDLRALLRREPSIALKMLECVAERLVELDRSLTS